MPRIFPDPSWLPQRQCQIGKTVWRLRIAGWKSKDQPRVYVPQILNFRRAGLVAISPLG
jgi:hypothetical protein